MVVQSDDFLSGTSGDARSLMAALEQGDYLGMICSINSAFSIFTLDGVFGYVHRLCMSMEGQDQVVKSKEILPTEKVFSQVIHLFFKMVKMLHDKNFNFTCEATVGSARPDFLVYFGSSVLDVIELKTDRVEDPLREGEKQIEKKFYGYGESAARKFFLVLVCNREKRMIYKAKAWEKGGNAVVYDENQCVKNEMKPKINHAEELNA